MKNNNLFWQIIFAGTALGMIANGAFMLIGPKLWYTELPARVADFGPYNEHFVRDIGCVYTVLGFISAAAVLKNHLRQYTAVLLALFYGTHSLLHIFDTARGFVGPEHWLIDLPLVHVPALIFIVIAWMLRRESGANAVRA